MNIDRALLTKSLMQGAVSMLVSRGIEPRLFTSTQDGQECAEVLKWAVSHTQRYNSSPSLQLLKERFPNWRGESSSDSLEALIDLFLIHVKRRMFSAKVLEFARIENDPSQWHRLDEALFDAARDLSAWASSSRVSRLSEMQGRIEQYEREAQEGTTPGFALGIPQFDEMIGNVRPGNVIVISGYLGLGKSTLATLLSMNVVGQDNTVLFLPLEMSRREVLERVDTMLINFPHQLLRERALPEQDLALWKRLALQHARSEHDFITVEMPGQSCTVSRVYAEISRYRPALTVIDYVQLMRRTRDAAQSWESLVEITNELKSIALATESVILIVSQDGRAAADGGSTLASMGGSISIGQVADIYIGMHQDEEMYAQNRMKLRLLKARNARRNKDADLYWDPAHMRFEPIQDGQEHRAFLRVVA